MVFAVEKDGAATGGFRSECRVQQGDSLFLGECIQRF